MEGFNVLFPIGWDAFGLPTENYAIKTGVHPSIATEKNVSNFKRQLKSLGLSFDWSREVNTTDPKYYKWTQWIFLKLLEKGLAYQAEIPVNWCPSCKIGLANEEVVNGECERCHTQVEKKTLKQWMIKITAYADRLIEDLGKVDYLEKIKTQQINWIGKSFGTEAEFKIEDSEDTIKIFTTRIDTIFGVTAVVIAPEHSLAEKLIKEERREEARKYIIEAKKKSEFEREKMEKEKTGVFTGSFCINPLNGEKVPIWIGDYVISTYGGGAVMMVPAHDYRDFDFAKRYGLEIREVISGGDVSEDAFVDYGTLVNSGEFTGLSSKDAIEKITDRLIEDKLGKRTIQYKLRDWVFSRQHYWGEPIPVIHCEECKSKKYKYLLLHGRHGGSQRDFFPWLRNELEALGHQVYSPDLPNTEDPKVEEQADFIIKNFKIGPDTVIIGHSLGGAVALNILEKVSRKVAKVVFVDSLIYPKFNDKRRLDLERNFHWKFNFEKIKKLSDEFVDLADQNFPIIPKEQFEEKNKLLNTRLLYVKPNADHFNSNIEPLILEYAIFNGIYPVLEKDLPVELPYVEKYQPTGTGESPLSVICDWVDVKCPKCKGKAKRETDTMPNWAGSDWYYMRYCDPKNNKVLADLKKLKYWLPVDWYNGGMEHVTLHLLYSRFIYKFLYDIGAAPDSEPYQKRTAHGIVLAADGRKMSKSFGNVINPDEIVEKYGADTLRMYEMFMGPFDQAISWNEDGVKGVHRFLDKTWKLVLSCSRNKESDGEIKREINKLNKKVDEDMEATKFNTIVAAFMEFINLAQDKKEKVGRDTLEKLLILLSPFTPHISEELWNIIGHKKSIFSENWPKSDVNLIREDKIDFIVQINGKIRVMIEIKAGTSEEEARTLAISQEKVQNWIAGKEIKKVIFVPDKLINIVV